MANLKSPGVSVNVGIETYHPPVFEWLDMVSRCGDVEIQMAAEVLKNYYQGVSPQDMRELNSSQASAEEHDQSLPPKS